MTRRLLGLTLLLGFVASLWTVPAWAIPVFARKYGYNCTMCHSNFPRLNDYGVRYRQNGYQLPGGEEKERTVLETPVPLSVRTSFGYTSDQFSDTPGAEEVNQFRVEGVDVLSGGLLGRNIGYFFAYLPELHGSRSVAPQAGTVEQANVIFSNLGSTWLNVRGGRFESSALPFSVRRQLSVAPYEIYDFTFPGGLRLSDTQTGVEVTGYDWRGWKYTAGWANGTENDRDDTPADFYVRGVKVLGRGEGQTVGQRLGVTAHFGRARPLEGGSREGFSRVGVDASLNRRQLNLELQYLTAHDDAALWGSSSDVDYSGGFAQLNYLPTTRLVGFTRYDWVDAPDDLAGNITRWTLGGRYYPVDNLALHVEYSHRKERALEPGGGEPTERLWTARVDVAF